MKKTISSSKAPKAIGPYSQAVEANNMLFVSGQVPINPDTGKIAEYNIKEQTSQVLKNIKAILDEAGYSIDQVVKTTCFLNDLNNFKEMNEVYAQFFDNNPPARATIQVARLPLDSLIEIEVIAVK